MRKLGTVKRDDTGFWRAISPSIKKTKDKKGVSGKVIAKGLTFEHQAEATLNKWLAENGYAPRA